MGNVRVLLIGIVALASSGCIGSVNAVLPDRALLFDERLLGTWHDSASREHAVITRDGLLRYAIAYTDDRGETVSLIGRLGRDRDRFILDVQPVADSLGAYRDLVVRLHIPVLLDAIGPRIHVAILEPDSLNAFLYANPGAIAHGRTDDGVTLTASSADIQRFLSTYLQRPGVRAAPSTWTRRAP